MLAVLGGESPLLLFVETRAELRDDGLAAFVEAARTERPDPRTGFREPYYRPGRTFTDLDGLYGFPFTDEIAAQLFRRRG